MPTRTTAFPDGPLIRVFRKVEEILKADPVLAGNVRTWSTWDGASTMADTAPITPSMCPYIQLSPVKLPSDVQAVGRSVVFLGIRITAAVEGLVAEDIVNFWDAIEDSLTLGKQFQGSTAYCTLQGLKAFSHRFVAPGIDAFQSKDNPSHLFLQGSGLLVLRISRTA